MKVNKYLKTFYLVKKLNKFRDKTNAKKNGNQEICENYYRVDDHENDDRGLF